MMLVETGHEKSRIFNSLSIIRTKQVLALQFCVDCVSAIAEFISRTFADDLKINLALPLLPISIEFVWQLARPPMSSLVATSSCPIRSGD